LVIIAALLSEIKSRSLDTYYETESKLLMAGGTRDSVVSISNLLLDPAVGTFEDKLRLFLVYYLSNKNSAASDSEMEQLAQSLVASDDDGDAADRELLLNALTFVKKWM
jgi:hypothetical protein